MRAESNPDALSSMVNGYTVVFIAGAMVAAALVAVFMIRGTKEELLPSGVRIPMH